MAHIVLHGDLATFGGPFNLDVASTTEAVRALCSQLKGFRRRLSEGKFRVMRKSAFGMRDLALNVLSAKIKSSHEIHIVPVIEGSGGRGGKIMLGIGLVAASFAFAPAGAVAIDEAGATISTSGIDLGASAFSILGQSVTFGQIAGFGAAMILGGIAQMLSPTPKWNSSASPINPGGLFGGPANTSTQGSASPLVYGRFISGSVVISSSLDPENATS